MEGLIKQAFLHVDVIGPHVHEGHYDLVGPDGEIILPQVWESMIQPDMTITMHMWPMPEPPPPPPQDIPSRTAYGMPPPPPPPPGVTTINVPTLGIPAKSRSKKKQGKTKVDSWMTSVPPPPPPPPPANVHYASSAALPTSPQDRKDGSTVPPPIDPKIFTPPPPPLIWDIPTTIAIDSPRKKKSKADSSSAFMKWAAGARPGPSEKLRTHGRFDKMYDDSDGSVPSSSRRKKERVKKKDSRGGGEGDVDVVEELLTKWTDEVD